MDDAMKAEVTAWLKAIRENVGGLKSWSLEQAPEVAREMVAWGRASYAAGLLIWLTIGITCAVALCRTWRAGIRDWDDYGESREVLCIFSCVAFGAGVAAFAIGAPICLFGLIEATFAPRLYVLRQLAALLK